jgi:hypothetical protein
MPVAVAAWAPDRLDIFGLGTLRYLHKGSPMYHKAWNGTAWRHSQTGWENLDGLFLR